MLRRNKLSETAVKSTCTPVGVNHVQRLVRTAECVRNRTTSQPAVDPKSGSKTNRLITRLQRRIDRDRKTSVKSTTKQHAATHLIKVGDRLLVKQDKRNKLSTYFNNKPYTVIAVKETMINEKRNNHQITRNSSWMKTIPQDSDHGYMPSLNEEERKKVVC